MEITESQIENNKAPTIKKQSYKFANQPSNPMDIKNINLVKQAPRLSDAKAQIIFSLPD